MACIVGRRSFLVNQTFPQHEASWDVPYDDALGPEVQRPVFDGDRSASTANASPSGRIGESAVGWQPIHQALSDNYDVIAFDLPGFGRSPALPPGVAPTAAAWRTPSKASWTGWV